MGAQGIALLDDFERRQVAIAQDDLGALGDRISFELPRMVEKLRRIDEPSTQECRDCHQPFPYTPEADICPACVAAGEGVAA